MLLQRSVVELTTLFSCSGTIFCVLLHFATNISPITGVWFPIYFLLVFVVSLCASFKFIQWLLRLNKPIQYDLNGILKDYPSLTIIASMLPQTRRPKGLECREYDTNELSVISTVLERKLVSSWYMPYISQEIGFPFACKQMLDQIIGKTFQISNKIESRDIFTDICTILDLHLKEYQKAVKRHEKSPTDSTESFYKKSHAIYDNSNKKIQSADHCTSVLRIIFKELVPWELWDTPHSELLVRILSKKLDHFIDNTLADPQWLNIKLLTILKGESEIQIAEDKKEDSQAPADIPNVKHETQPLETITASFPNRTIVPTSQRTVNENSSDEAIDKTVEDIAEEIPFTSSEPVDIKTSPVLRQRRGRQGRNEVKIYDRIIEGSVKTWDTDIDLQCISLGQDLLASLDGEITLSRLWGQDADADGSPNPPRSKSPQPLWFGEEETIEVDPIDSSPNRECKKEHSPKPTELLKDLQSTVNQAKTKIGDLQVAGKVLDVPCKQSSGDEAAGMMEGLLDFGIAGLKKGLRFTGLSDDSQEKSPSHHRSDKFSPPDIVSRNKSIVPESKDIHTFNALREENTSAPPLVKQHRVISQDSVPVQAKSVVRSEPLPVPAGDSPEPEYEEAADLSTSIAKLRCLLQQRADISPRVEDVWWESAEETKGRTQHHHSSRPVDTATLADEYDMNMERNSSPGQSSNNMQRLDKLLQRTVTGVFNSLRTAVGAEGAGGAGGAQGAEGEQRPAPARDWTYVTTSVELSVGGAVARLVGSRRAFSHVEAALDSLDQLPVPPVEKDPVPEDYDEWLGAAGARWAGACAAAAGARLVTSHVALRLATLLLADLGESLLESWLADVATYLRREVFVLFERMSERNDNNFANSNTVIKKPVDVEETCRAIIDRAPALLNVFGEETVSRAANLLVSSFTHKQINKDFIFRLLDLGAAHFKKAASLRHPSFDSH